jgi:hypothetical protein
MTVTTQKITTIDKPVLKKASLLNTFSLTCYLSDYLSDLGFSHLQIYVCSSEHSKDCHQLLVFVEHENLFVFGCLASIYWKKDKESLVYIDKIDSSGYFQNATTGSLPRSVMKAVLSLFSYAQETRFRIHVFARAQTQFLFPESSKNPLKHILGERALVQWWGKTLASLDNLEKGWYFVPGETEVTTQDVKQVLKGKEWSYGWPWPKQSKACQVRLFLIAVYASTIAYITILYR